MSLISDPHSLHVMQGKVRLSERPDDALVAILGSCVAACVRDPLRRIGGMNHFLLPGDDPRASGNVRYGAHSMEELINALLRQGADRRRLEVWLYGGAAVLGGATGIGESNAIFAREFVAAEGFHLRGSDLGGTHGRRIRFTPYTGEVQVITMDQAPIDKPTPKRAPLGSVELF